MSTLEQNIGRARKTFRAKMWMGLLGFALMICGAAVFALTFNSVRFFIEPPAAAQEAEVTLCGAGLAVGGRVLMFGARAELQVAARGYLARAVEVRAGESPLRIEMQVAPARAVVNALPPLAEIEWHVNGVYAATAPQLETELAPGAVTVEARHAFYLPASVQFDAQPGDEVTREIILPPLNASIDVQSEPHGAQVTLDAGARGVTPLQLSGLRGGAHRLQVALPGYELVDEEILLTQTSPSARRDYRLRPLRHEVRVTVTPRGGELFVDGVRTAPGAVQLQHARAHVLRYEKPGYAPQTRKVTPPAAEISFALEKEFGEVEIRSTPRAQIFLDGKSAGQTPRTMRLQTVAHNIQLTRAGYRAREVTVTPSASSATLLDEKLQTELSARMSEAMPTLTAPGGVVMKLFDPRKQPRFTMGAPADDKHRRANEFRRKVQLQKPFYAGVTEVSEEQFSQYKNIAVAGKNLPARNVTWLDAAGFANWMSMRAGLQPAYQISGGALRGFDARADGYRLLSEAEWEWLARVAARVRPARFVWGNAEVIPAGSGNFADESAKGKLPAYIPRYADGFAGVAPVASFAADAAGLYDVAGNLGEWVHDAHDLRQPGAQLAVDPFGALLADAERVVKGASFRSASLVQLRASYRRGESRARDDVGFRVARYVYGAAE